MALSRFWVRRSGHNPASFKCDVADGDIIDDFVEIVLEKLQIRVPKDIVTMKFNQAVVDIEEMVINYVGKTSRKNPLELEWEVKDPLVEALGGLSITDYASDERRKYTCAADIIKAIHKLHDYTGIEKSLLDDAVQNKHCEIRSTLQLSSNPNSHLHQIYIRYDYTNIWKKIETEVTHVGTQRFIITGSSGIGKSCFMGYAIVQLLKSKKYNVIIYSVQWETLKRPEYYIITEDCVKRADELLIHVLLTTTPVEGINIMWLMDVKQHGPYQSLNINVVVVLSASFSEANYKEFMAHSGTIPTMIYMPWWSQTDGGELVGLQTHLMCDENEHSSEDNGQRSEAEEDNGQTQAPGENLSVKAAINHEFSDLVILYSGGNTVKMDLYCNNYYLAGPNPRYVFKTTNQHTLRSVINTKANSDLSLAHLAYSSQQHSQITDTQSASSKIFCAIIDRKHYLPTGKVVYVSQFACEMLSEHLRSKSYNERIAYLVGKRVLDDSTKWGQTFESHMHKFFIHCTLRKFKIVPLPPSHTRTVSEREESAQLTLPVFEQVHSFSELDSYLTPSVYYRPISRYHISVDSFYVDLDGKTLNFFQCTTRKYHPVMAQGLQSVVEKGNYNRVNLIFVVPSEKYCLRDEECILNAQTVTNKSSNRHKAISQQKFTDLERLISQWKLVVNIEDTRDVL